MAKYTVYYKQYQDKEATQLSRSRQTSTFYINWIVGLLLLATTIFVCSMIIDFYEWNDWRSLCKAITVLCAGSFFEFYILVLREQITDRKCKTIIYRNLALSNKEHANDIEYLSRRELVQSRESIGCGIGQYLVIFPFACTGFISLFGVGFSIYQMITKHEFVNRIIPAFLIATVAIILTVFLVKKASNDGIFIMGQMPESPTASGNVCKKCNRMLSSGDVYCPKCGKKVRASKHYQRIKGPIGKIHLLSLIALFIAFVALTRTVDLVNNQYTSYFLVGLTILYLWVLVFFLTHSWTALKMCVCIISLIPIAGYAWLSTTYSPQQLEYFSVASLFKGENPITYTENGINKKNSQVLYANQLRKDENVYVDVKCFTPMYRYIRVVNNKTSTSSSKHQIELPASLWPTTTVTYTDVICKCNTINGDTIWISMSINDYKEFIDATAALNGKSFSVSSKRFGSPIRLHGKVVLSEDEAEGLQDKIGCDRIFRVVSVQR